MTPESISDGGDNPERFSLTSEVIVGTSATFPTLTLEDVEGCMHGFASIESSNLDLHLYQEEDLQVWQQALREGFLTLPYEKAKNRLALLVLWEMYCWVLRKPTLWLFPSDTNPVVGLNIKTTGYTFGVKGWIELNSLCRQLGLTPNKHSAEGVRSFQGRPLQKTWHKQLSNLVLQNCKGKFRDRLGYRITWNNYGNLWRMRNDETILEQ